MIRAVEDILKFMILTLSTPLKPGSVHRLSPDPEFEHRLVEVLSIAGFMEEAYRRGSDLAQGRITASSLGLGHLIGQGYRRVFEEADVKPLPGVTASCITLSAIMGYSVESGLDPLQSLSRLILNTIYRSGPDDAISMIEGMEAVGLADELLHLEYKGLTKRAIKLEARSLGDVFEVLAERDAGFLLNIKNYNDILRLARRAQASKSIIHAILRTYLDLASIVDPRFRGMDESRINAKTLARLDKEVRATGRLDSLLGGVLVSVYLGYGLRRERRIT
ncbi:MAG: hypothetical protein GSR85_02880 [Desulfurococcales archaeon]|nr:hypothetical protein [Desulfurococcales archaeon]